MAHTYMRFDFGTDEEKAQEARHKLDVWKQAFRLDQKLQYKLERPDDESEQGEEANSEEHQEKGKKPSSDSAKTGHGEENGAVSLLVRLYFSSHEKISEKQWLERIPAEEPFKSASPKVIRKGQAGFDEAVEQFGDLDKATGRRG
jgi:hypothetical protein